MHSLEKIYEINQVVVKASHNPVLKQGHEIGRPSLLHLKANSTLKKIEISVGGKVIFVASGILH